MDKKNITCIDEALDNVGRFKYKNSYTIDNLVLYFTNASIFISYDSIIAVSMYNGNTILTNEYDRNNTTGKYRNKYLNYDLKTLRKKLEDSSVILDKNYSQ